MLRLFIFFWGIQTIVFAQTWQEIPNAPKHDIRHNDVWFLNDSLGWLVNGSGYIYQTKDSGKTWDTLFYKEYTHFRAVCFVNENRGFAGNIGRDVVAGGLDSIPLYETFDGGRSWKAVVLNGVKVKGICNFFRYDDTTLMATGRMGGGGFFLRTDDKGENWSVWDFGSEIGLAIDCYFISKNEGFIVGGTDSLIRRSTPAIWHTVDGGKSWEKVFEQTTTKGATCWKIHFPTQDIGYITILDHANPATFIKTIDGGKTWQSYPLSTAKYGAKGIYFINEKIGWIAGDDKNASLLTLDGGLHWQIDLSLGFSINRIRKIGNKLIAVGKRVHELAL